MESLAKVSFRHHSSRDSAWDSESSWSVKLTADTQFILRKERKGKTVCHSVFCVNKDYYFKTVQISSGSFASSSIGWIWLWVGALAIHSKKKKKSQEIHSHGMNFSEPGNEQRVLEVTSGHLDEWCQRPSAHCNSYNVCSTAPVFWD